MLCVFGAGLCHFSIALSTVFAILCCLSLDWEEGHTRSPRCSLSLEPLPRDFSAVLSSLGTTVWRQKAGKGPDPVSLLVVPWQFL